MVSQTTDPRISLFPHNLAICLAAGCLFLLVVAAGTVQAETAASDGEANGDGDEVANEPASQKEQEPQQTQESDRHGTAEAHLGTQPQGAESDSTGSGSARASNDDDEEEEAHPWRRPPGLSASRNLSRRPLQSEDAPAASDDDASAWGSEGYVYRKKEAYRWFSPASIALGVRMFPVSVEFWNDDGPERYSFSTTTIGLDLGLALSPADTLRFTFLAGAEFTVSAFDVEGTMEPRPLSTIIPGGRLLLGFDIEVRALSLGVRYGLREFWADEEDEGQMTLIGHTRQHTVMQLLGAIVINDRLRLGLGLEFPLHDEVIDYTILFEFSLRFHIS